MAGHAMGELELGGDDDVKCAGTASSRCGVYRRAMARTFVCKEIEPMQCNEAKGTELAAAADDEKAFRASPCCATTTLHNETLNVPATARMSPT